MRKLILLGLILFQGVLVYSQVNTESISFGLRYPYPTGYNYINKGLDNGYLGIIDVEVDYGVLKLDKLSFGLLFNASHLKLSKTDMDLWIISPKIKIDYRIKINKFSLIPQFGIGYSNWRFRSPAYTLYDEYGTAYKIEGYKRNENGLSLKTATKIEMNINDRLQGFFQLAYEFTRLEKPETPAKNSNDNRNMQILYPVFGIN